MSTVLPDQNNAKFYDIPTDHLHNTVAGANAIAQALNTFMISDGGAPYPKTPGFFNRILQPIYGINFGTLGFNAATQQTPALDLYNDGTSQRTGFVIDTGFQWRAYTTSSSGIFTFGQYNYALSSFTEWGRFDSTGAKTSRYNTTANCSSAASPAVCAAASSGSVVIAAGATSVQVNTTAVTANSQILLNNDSSLGTKLGVTCNTGFLASPPQVTARTAATNFTFSVSAAPSTNPQCFSYTIIGGRLLTKSRATPRRLGLDGLFP
ncbi:hypothetical protein [Terriglobus albidus]|uniref:hypothetical protein n=1 Tax=Terriglobus albidus TaxID=1592106 RepID=UPI0021DFD410|nr:hypothetical protein [Terriglobus albidus]